MIIQLFNATWYNLSVWDTFVGYWGNNLTIIWEMVLCLPVSDISGSSHRLASTFTRQIHFVSLLLIHTKIIDHSKIMIQDMDTDSLLFSLPFTNLSSFQAWSGVGVASLCRVSEGFDVGKVMQIVLSCACFSWFLVGLQLVLSLVSVMLNVPIHLVHEMRS